jgi:shikimate dehydrogenase
MTNKFCVVGSPISHSLSPALHNAAYKYLDFDFSYEAFEVSAGNLAKFLEDSDFQGVSVTMPLKKEALELSKSRSDQAQLTLAANTLSRTSGGWAASNTDVYGLVQALRDIPAPTHTAILGAGSTTSSALCALAELFPGTEVSIMARDELSAKLSVEFGKSLGLAVSGANVSAAVLRDSDLVLSLVPPGSFENAWSQVSDFSESPTGWLFDAAYNPWPTLPARSWGSERVISGLEMLTWQAIEQVALFAASAGHELELDRSQLYSVMKAAVSNK